MAISKISGSGIGAINAPVEFTSADNLTQLTLTSTDTDANSGPLLELSRNVTGANNDFLGQVIFKGKDTAGNVHTFGRVSTQIKTATSGSETSRMVLTTNVGGSEVSRIDIHPTETVINDDSVDLDFRVESNLDTHALFVDGAQSGAVGIGVTPKVWSSSLDFLQIGTAASFWGSTNTSVAVVQSNAYFNASDTYKYINTDQAAQYIQVDGTHVFSSAVSGSADATVTFVESLRINAASIVTMPLQPAFQANIDNTQANINGTVKINFATQVFDQGNNFQPGTGDGQGGDTSNKTATFAAPATGKYQLNVSIRLENIDSAAGYYQVSIITSNRNYRYIFDPDFGQDNAFFTPSISILADMDTSDTAFVQIQQSGGSAQTDMHPETYFSGYLVC